METIEVVLEIELDGRADSIEVSALFEYEGGLSGIGNYEFQGQKCFDEGYWQVEGVWFKDFECDETLTAAEKKQIEIYCENYAESGNVEDKIYSMAS